MDISIVICTHNRAPLLRQTLDTLAQARRPPATQVEILVVANACSDDTHALLAEAALNPVWNDLPLRWFPEPRPGKSFALNRAISETESAALCFIDDDQFVDQNFLPALATALTEHPDYDIICGRINPAWDGSEPSWVHETGRYRIPIRPFPEFDFGNTPKEIPPGHKLPSGGNITVRRRAFTAAGTFSIALGPQGHNLMGGEDLEFIARCMDKGLRIIYVPAIKQLHAIEPERMTTLYMMRKSYLRSLSSELMAATPNKRLRFYMLLKPASYAACALFTLDNCRRFHFLIRLSATLGELRAALSAMCR